MNNNNTLTKLKMLVKKPSLLINKIKRIYFYILEVFFVIIDKISLVTYSNKILFIDAGSNLGQGCKFFSFFFCSKNFYFELFEPNENCEEYLNKFCCSKGKNFTFHNCAISTENKIINFYGVDESEGGLTSEGGSIVENHNSAIYAFNNNRNIIQVNAIDFKKYILLRKDEYNKIIIKMDIEGAEVDVLEDLIESGTMQHISIIYVEFHSVYKIGEERMLTIKREKNIIHKIKKDFPNVKLRIWH